MNPWFEFLKTQGAQFEGDELRSFGESPSDYENLLGQTLLFCPANRGIIALTGPDTEKFLQGQTTCDITALDTNRPLAGAICTAKGRMIASFHLVKAIDQGILLLLNAGVLNDTLTHLKKYAVFFKTKLEDVSNCHIILGVGGPVAATVVNDIFAVGPATRVPENIHAADATVVCTGLNTYLCILRADAAETCWLQLAQRCQPAGQPCWQLIQIRQGLGEVSADTREEFIPQMLNLQVTGGISFRKGCYTGQEVVARMQYLGKLKRRMYRLAAKGVTAPPPGSPCYVREGDQSIGNVVSACRADLQQLEMLAVLTTEGAEAKELIMGGHRYPVTCLPLPYEDQLQSRRS